MRRKPLLILTAIVSLAIGFAAGFYAAYRMVETTADHILASDELRAGSSNLRFIQSALEGHLDRAYLLAEAQIMGAFTLAHSGPVFDGVQRQYQSNFEAQVVEFYRHYPERRAVLQATYAGNVDLMRWLDGGS